MNVNLLTSTALTYANFLKYANAGDWDNTFLHRSVQSGFKILQGGGFKLGTNNSIVPVTSRGNINNETGLTNVRGTIAMANAGLNTNNSQWYFNNGDNAAAFGNNYTVFGSLADATSFRVMDALGGLPIFNASAIIGATFKELPVVNHTGTGLSTSNLAWIYRVAMKDSVAKTPGT